MVWSANVRNLICFTWAKNVKEVTCGEQRSKGGYISLKNPRVFQGGSVRWEEPNPTTMRCTPHDVVIVQIRHVGGELLDPGLMLRVTNRI